MDAILIEGCDYSVANPDRMMIEEEQSDTGRSKKVDFDGDNMIRTLKKAGTCMPIYSLTRFELVKSGFTIVTVSFFSRWRVIRWRDDFVAKAVLTSLRVCSGMMMQRQPACVCVRLYVVGPLCRANR